MTAPHPPAPSGPAEGRSRQGAPDLLPWAAALAILLGSSWISFELGRMLAQDKPRAARRIPARTLVNGRPAGLRVYVTAESSLICEDEGTLYMIPSEGNRTLCIGSVGITTTDDGIYTRERIKGVESDVGKGSDWHARLRTNHQGLVEFSTLEKRRITIIVDWDAAALARAGSIGLGQAGLRPRSPAEAPAIL